MLFTFLSGNGVKRMQFQRNYRPDHVEKITWDLYVKSNTKINIFHQNNINLVYVNIKCL